MTAVLPRTRSFHRARPMRLWWLATGLALLVNLAVVVGLSQVSRLHPAVAEPPLAVRSLRRSEVETPPPPPVVEPAPTFAAAVAGAPPAMPSLDLPALGPPDALTLPALGSLDADLVLPLVLPAFTASDAPAGQLASAGSAPPEVDAPAQLIGGFDLDHFYPRSARMRGLAGSTRLRLAIAADGQVSGVEVLSSDPPGVFEQAAERLGRSLRHHPATRAGQPVASVLERTIVWQVR
jgi:protein TonB